MSDTISPEQMDLSVHLYTHTTYDDAMSFLEHALEATVLAPEMPALPSQVEKEFQKVIRGNANAYLNFQKSLGVNGDFGRGVLDVVKTRANKPGRRFAVKLLDVPGTPEWIRRMDEIRSLEDIAFMPTIDESIELIHKRLSRSVELQSSREDIIADNTDDFVRNSMVNTGSTSENSRLLIPIGYLHKDLLTKLEERGLPAHATENSHQDNGEYIDEAWLQIKAGNTPSRELCLRSFLGLIIRGEAAENEHNVIQSPDTLQRIRVIRSIIDLIDIADLEPIMQESTKVISAKGIAGLYEIGRSLMTQYVGQPTLNAAEVESFKFAPTT